MKAWDSNRDSRRHSCDWKGDKTLVKYCKDFDVYAE